MNKLLKSLEAFLRDKNHLAAKAVELAKTERALIGGLDRLLSNAGYRLVPLSGSARPVEGGSNHRSANGAPKRLRCPRCARRFSHPLPMARHMSATHGAKKAGGRAKTVKR